MGSRWLLERGLGSLVLWRWVQWLDFALFRVVTVACEVPVLRHGPRFTFRLSVPDPCRTRPPIQDRLHFTSVCESYGGVCPSASVRRLSLTGPSATGSCVPRGWESHFLLFVSGSTHDLSVVFTFTWGRGCPWGHTLCGFPTCLSPYKRTPFQSGRCRL